MDTQRIRLQALGDVNEQGEFEIVAITQGIGNGWEFTAETLRDSVPKWNGVNSLVDHVGFFDAPSITRLCGVIHSARWSEERQGVMGTLRPIGPMASVVTQLGKDILALKKAGKTAPSVGFSGDIMLTATGKKVQAITQINSLDLVLEPARGGEFVRAVNQAAVLSRSQSMAQALHAHRPEVSMSDTTQPTTPAPTQSPTLPAAPTAGPGGLQSQLAQDVEAIRTLFNAQAQQAAIQAEAEAMREIRREACQQMLDIGLAQSRLPAPAQEQVRKQFAGKVFTPDELNAAIGDARDLVAKLTASSVIQGPGRISAMFNAEDQLQLAVHDLFGVPRDASARNAKTHRLTGIRELYIGMTGDAEFRGAFDPSRAQFGTGNFTNLVADAMNKVVVNRWGQLGAAGYNWWEKIATPVQTKDLKEVKWLIMGTIASLPTITKGAEYTPLKFGDGKETSAYTKYGGYVGIDLEDLINDDTERLKLIPRALADAGLRNISSLVAALFTANSGVGPTLQDTGALFNATAVTTQGGHANLLTTALGTDYTAWNAVASAVYNQPMLVANESGYYGTGKKQAVDPRYILVPKALQTQAESLFLPRWEAQAQNVAAVSPTWGGRVEPVVVPDWTDANDYAAVVDPAIAPGVMIGHVFGLLPEIFSATDENSAAMFANDELRIKTRHFIATGVSDFRTLHKSNVA